MSSLLHLVGMRPRVYHTLTNFRGGGARPLWHPLNTPMKCLNKFYSLSLSLSLSSFFIVILHALLVVFLVTVLVRNEKIKKYIVQVHCNAFDVLEYYVLLNYPLQSEIFHAMHIKLTEYMYTTMVTRNKNLADFPIFCILNRINSETT